MLSVETQRGSGKQGEEIFDISGVTCSVCILITGDGLQHLLFSDGCRAFQLAVSGAGLIEPAGLTMDVLWPPGRVRQRVDALACLNALRSTGQLLPRFSPAEPRSIRLCSVLRALDGSIAGASHREIGIALSGRARIDHDWTDPGDHLRDMVRRAIRRGRALMNGGYRQFLQ
ncbi:DUF2285 domain-containing protein [Mesorhizobium amorphae]|uniref:DUF2285 domain-containing protein n=1 Tax=Mesorhizobium amorphae TaxID=71433 RepID=UPI0021B37C0E|nr:DUF2285 domain-containing protein [Mesorhizobium amorphae]